MVRDNPSAGNYEELADLYMEDRDFSKARECYNRAISSRTDSLDPFYRRGVCSVELGDLASADAGSRACIASESGYDFYRAGGLLAHAYAEIGQKEKRETVQASTVISTLSETY